MLGKAAGMNNIPADIIKHGQDLVPDFLMKMCNMILTDWLTV